MKKNFKYLAVLCMVLGLSFYSCEEDSDVTNEELLVTPSEVNIQFTDSNNGMIVSETGTVSYVVSLSRALDVDAVITFNVTSSDGSLESNPGYPEVAFTEQVSLAAGQTSVVLDLTFSDDRINEASEDYVISITNLSPVSGNFDTNLYVVNGSDDSRNIEVVDFINTGNVVFTLTWDDGSQDNDLRLFEGNQDVSNELDSSTSVGASEDVTLDGGEFLGEYSLWIEQWPSFSADVEYTLTVSVPDEADQIFTGKATSDGFFAVIEKTADAAGIPQYAITQL